MRLGEVVQLGQHRLMCGDAGDPKDVAALFGDAKPDLVFTSPPYLQQRTYGKAIGCWDTLMQRVFGAMPHHDRTQVLVNLGLVHRDGEWLPYWDGWIKWMRLQGWRRCGWYVWDKLAGLPTIPARGRLYPSHEFIFHFCQLPRTPNRTAACVSAGKSANAKGLRRPNDKAYARPKGAALTINETRIADSVIRLTARGNSVPGHVAAFPVALPAAIHAAYTDYGELVYDPFAGSGTSLLAAEQGGRIAYCMELEPAYCDIAIARWNKRKPMQHTLALQA